MIGLASWAALRFRRAKGEFDGIWYGEILGETGGVRARDTFTLTQRRESFRGRFTRTFPLDQQGRAWDFEGRIQNQCFFAIYWSTNQRNISSGGCWFLRQTDDDTFEGYYYRQQQKRDNIEQPIAARRLRLSRRPYGPAEAIG